MMGVDLNYLETVVDYVQSQRPLPDLVGWKYRMKEVVASKDPAQIRKALQDLQNVSEVDLGDYFLFVDIIPWEKIQQETKHSLPEPIKMAIKAHAVAGAATWIPFQWRDLTWDEIKEITRFAADGHYSDIPLVVPFSENLNISGTLTTRITNYQVEVPVAGVYKGKKGVGRPKENLGDIEPEEEIIFADEPSKGLRHPLRALFWKGYLYEMIGDDGARYFIIIPDEIQLSYGKVKGMLVPVVDHKTLGETSKLRTVSNMILAKSWEMIETTIDQQKVAENRQPDFDSLYKKIFGELRHPHWFERLLLAWMFSGKINGYPLHLLFIAPPHTGKSAILEVVEKHFPGDAIYGQGTLKGIVPSFGAGKVRVGEFLKRKRFFLADEFFRIVKRNWQEEGLAGDAVGLLNEILEHKSRVASSGVNEVTIEINPRARMLAMTNWAMRIKSIPDLAKTMDPAFLSRLLIYVMTKEHKKYVLKNKERLQKDGWHSDNIQKWEGLPYLVDWAQSFAIPQIDYKKVYEKVQKHVEIVPAGAEDIFEGRYSDHFARILDGVVKTRYLCGEKDDYRPDDSDYEWADQIFGAVIASWKGDIDISELPPKLRVAYLPKTHADVFYWVQKSSFDGVALKDLEFVIDKTPQAILDSLRELRQIGLVKRRDSRCYAYWVERVTDEDEDNKAEEGEE